MKIIANDGSGYEYEVTDENNHTVSFGVAGEQPMTCDNKTREQAMLAMMYQAYVDAYQGSDSQVCDEIEDMFQVMIKLAGKFPFPV